ncbi:hypothetical protein EJ03DRAFT_325554 [Teratosphaeria nubilosa]|uniref:Uncharacterized protein n=1 Tax=Teratosphaeria nubilosa TaxID=161662 RepID=A0A6G1LF75_9PEZI|nr:hypothetical protein EJ03DRAFT_325554 [Teratosphaeria nubilosa]
MAARKYTIEELLHLRHSPNICKPANLPAIEQWIDESQHSEQPKRAQRQPAARSANNNGNEASPMGNFSTGQRPGLIHTRSAAARAGDDVTLGPPKMNFSSSRNTTRLSDFADKASPAEDTSEQQENQSRSRFFGDKQGNRRSGVIGETDGKQSRESWTEARQRRAQQSEDDKGDGVADRRFGRRDREHDVERRNGFGDRQDNRWSREDRRPNGERPGGWRDRERQREEREYGRGHADKEPEWMDDPAPKQDDDLGSMTMPKNQEEFEKWKKAQHARNKQSVEEPEALTAEPSPPKEVAPAKAVAPLRLDGILDRPFGSLGDMATRKGSTPDAAVTPGKSTVKSKQSRFMPMFKKDEPKEDSPAAEPAPPPGMAGLFAEESTEDKEGFQRILQMLGSANLPQAPPPQVPQSTPASLPAQGAIAPVEPSSPHARQVSNGGKPKSRFTGFFDQAAKSPERVVSPQSGNEGPFRSMTSSGMLAGLSDHESSGAFSGQLPESRASQQPSRAQGPPNAISPDPMTSSALLRERERDQSRPQSSRLNDVFLEQPPSRNAATPDINIQNLLASQRQQRPQAQDKQNSQFLLDLMKGSSRPTPQQARPEPNFPLWVADPPNVAETHAPKPRAPPPPGFLDENLLRSHQPDASGSHQHQQILNEEMLGRRQSQRAPPGLFDEQQFFMQQQAQAQQQRRNITEPAYAQPRSRIAGHPGLPPMQIPQQGPGPQPPYPPEFLASPGAHQQAPPPGFNASMPRHPQGMHGETRIFMPPQQPQQLQRDLPPYLLQQQLGPSQQPGFYNQGPPPGFNQMRSPTEGGLPYGRR